MDAKIINFTVLTDGTQINVYKISNGLTSFSALNYGATLTSICTPNKNGTCENIIVSLPTLSDYVQNPKYFGATVGRVANRIKDARFNLDGKEFKLDKNEGKNCLHGGFESWSDKVFEAKTFCDEEKAGVIFERLSKEGEQGFPGNLKTQIIYTLKKATTKGESELTIEFKAETDKKTPVNIINHSYFNLSGSSHTSIDESIIQINSDCVLEKDKENLPTGKLLSVEKYKSDLRKPVTFKDAFEKHGMIFDDCFIISKELCEKNQFAALIHDEKSGRKMKVKTNQNAIQLYTPFYEKDEPLIMTEGRVWQGHACFALETQNYVDALHHENFPCIILEPDQTYHSISKFLFYC
ncbi:MAG: galactose mutarotase [Treponemataceae bacterium]|nr:galactose mutarotase [Treponemataceae bacterium]